MMLALGATPSIAACAHLREDVRTTMSESAPPSLEDEREAIAVDVSQPPVEQPVARPRLSRTITLGEGTESQYTSGPASPQAPPPTPGMGPTPSVVVNNHVYVDGARTYGGFAGYGGYAPIGRGGYGRPTTFFDGRSGTGYGSTQWGTTGWEGARRTAAPGQTPGIGGNWTPVPSYGPAQMK